MNMKGIYQFLVLFFFLNELQSYSIIFEMAFVESCTQINGITNTNVGNTSFKSNDSLEDGLLLTVKGKD